MNPDANPRLNILLRTEQDIWVAQCLDFDIAAQGKNIDGALDSLERVFIGQIVLDQKRERSPLENIPSAPAEFWKLFEKGTKIKKERFFYLPGYPAPTIADNLRIAA